MGFKNRDVEERVLIVDQGRSGFGWLMIGAAIGAGLALLYAPRSGEETRQVIGRRWDDLKEEAEEKFDEFSESVQEGREKIRAKIERLVDADRDGDREARPASAREELERRLTDARARRRSPDVEEEEPVA
ncbi:MAG TPA: YtxH domain-containing protein [Gemmatimonadales bacterium]|nr:YtxH domain-containing protein [Gemmatimonadales bacterium]